MSRFSIVTNQNASAIWKLIEDSARDELSFSKEAIAHFRNIFTDAEIIRRYNSQNAPVILLTEKELPKGVLIGSAPEGGVGTIIWLIVAPESRGQGIGRLLFEEACTRYCKAGAHKIKLTASTREAVCFYEKLGMTTEGFHPKHWWNLDFWSLGKLLK